jgi:hypothetical protein
MTPRARGNDGDCSSGLWGLLEVEERYSLDLHRSGREYCLLKNERSDS